jgi:hypothetical protein
VGDDGGWKVEAVSSWERERVHERARAGRCEGEIQSVVAVAQARMQMEHADWLPKGGLPIWSKTGICHSRGSDVRHSA